MIVYRKMTTEQRAGLDALKKASQAKTAAGQISAVDNDMLQLDIVQTETLMNSQAKLKEERHQRAAEIAKVQDAADRERAKDKALAQVEERNAQRQRWHLRPGQPGFNAEAHAKMMEFNVDHEFSSNCDGRIMPHQSTLKFLMRPNWPVSRMLVVHQTGAGKTRAMLSVLENYWSDPRPKILIFPTEATVNNFYKEMWEFDNKFCQYVLSRLKKFDHKGVVNALKTDVELLENIKNILGMKNELSARSDLAPFRAFSYKTAGYKGKVFTDGKAKPSEAIFGGRFWSGSGNPYDNKIVCMDEAHNLVFEHNEQEDDEENPKKYSVESNDKPLERLRWALARAKGTVLLACTATPFVTKKEQGRRLLDIVKGQQATGNDEGFVSYYYTRPLNLFPAVIDDPTTQLAMPLVSTLQGEQLIKYREKAAEYMKTLRCDDKHLDKDCIKLSNYATIMDYYGHAGLHYEKEVLQKFVKNTASYSSKIMTFMTKLKHDAKQNIRWKSIVMIDVRAGLMGCALILKQWLDVAKFTYGMALTKESQPVINQFNDPTNLRGEKMQVLIVNATEFSEGTNFYGVRAVYLMNPPFSYSRYRQQVGRSLRSCRYKNLEPEERIVRLYMLVAKDNSGRTIDDIIVDKLKRESAEFWSNMKEFEEVAVDRVILDAYFHDGPLSPIKVFPPTPDESLATILSHEQKESEQILMKDAKELGLVHEKPNGSFSWSSSVKQAMKVASNLGANALTVASDLGATAIKGTYNAFERAKTLPQSTAFKAARDVARYAARNVIDGTSKLVSNGAEWLNTDPRAAYKQDARRQYKQSLKQAAQKRQRQRQRPRLSQARSTSLTRLSSSEDSATPSPSMITPSPSMITQFRQMRMQGPVREEPQMQRPVQRPVQRLEPQMRLQPKETPKQQKQQTQAQRPAQPAQPAPAQRLVKPKKPKNNGLDINNIISSSSASDPSSDSSSSSSTSPATRVTRVTRVTRSSVR